MTLLWSVLYSLVLLIAVGTDLARLRIPNAIPLLVIGLALVKLALLPGEVSWLSHFGAFLVMFLLGFAGFAAQMVGGGDAKLIAAIGLWLGVGPLAGFLLVMGLSGAVFALLLVVLRALAQQRSDGELLEDGPAAERRALPLCLHPGSPIPYAVPIAFAALLTEWRF
jgi:prepilin peptidase CpaA